MLLELDVVGFDAQVYNVEFKIGFQIYCLVALENSFLLGTPNLDFLPQIPAGLLPIQLEQELLFQTQNTKQIQVNHIQNSNYAPILVILSYEQLDYPGFPLNRNSLLDKSFKTFLEEDNF